MACIDEAFFAGTDHGVGNRREENLHAQLLPTTGRSLRLAALDAAHPLGGLSCRWGCTVTGPAYRARLPK
jgi:hypothetical protein